MDVAEHFNDAKKWFATIQNIDGKGVNINPNPQEIRFSKLFTQYERPKIKKIGSLCSIVHKFTYKRSILFWNRLTVLENSFYDDKKTIVEIIFCNWKMKNF